MCGIAGWYRRQDRPVDKATMDRQAARLVHRGPDDVGTLVDGDFGFAMRRLSIIDVAHGHQPIADLSGRYSIVCNGEIVNHEELRRDLADTYEFSTRSDVETLLAAYLIWGDDAWLKLEGMYAAAIWDRSARVLTLARDPLGIKPLFISEQDGGIAFGSEIPALREVPDYRFDIDLGGVDDYFTFGHVLPPRSMFRQVRSLKPGHRLTIGANGEAATTRFWVPDTTVNHDLSEQDWIEQTRAQLLDTVDKHLLADVPVGAFLSGGLDGSAIAAAMVRSTSQKLTMFTAGFPGSPLDETAQAAQTAAHLGCNHVILPLQVGAAADILPAVQRSFDEPSAANSAVPLWCLSKAAKQHVGVVLCGEGSDELFLGYNRHRWAERMRRAKPWVSRMGNGALVDRLPVTDNRQLNYLRDHLVRFRDGARLANGYERFFHAVTISSPALRRRLYGEKLHDRRPDEMNAALLADREFPDRDHHADELDQFAMGDLLVHLPASLLQRLDRASMAHSLEARVPYLSHRFVDWALTMPRSMKLRGKVGKYALRQAVAPWLPPGVGKGAKKGFQIPLADWFAGGLNDFARDAWFGSGAGDQGFLDRAAVTEMFDDHRSGKANHGRMLYALAMFGCWWADQRQFAA